MLAANSRCVCSRLTIESRSVSLSAALRARQASRMADSPGQTEKAGEQGDGYEITRQNVLHHRYLHLYNRSVRYPDGNVHDFDVVGHPKADFQFTVTFPFHTETQEATVVHEYSQGPNKPMYCFPSGGFDKKKHDSLESCARAELHEEGQLAGGEMVRLLEGDTGLIETKWCINKFFPFLVIDPHHEESGAAHRDLEEAGMEVFRVSIAELRAIILRGDLQTPSLCTFFLGLDELARRGLLKQ